MYLFPFLQFLLLLLQRICLVIWVQPLYVRTLIKREQLDYEMVISNVVTYPSTKYSPLVRFKLSLTLVVLLIIAS